MTIGSVSAAPSQHAAYEAHGCDGSATEMAEQVAVLLLETQEHRKQLDREQLAAAREDFKAALENEVGALKAAADATLSGALFEAGMSTVSSGLALWSLGRDVDKTWQGEMSQSLDRLTQPLGAVVSNNYEAAHAKAAEGAETAAQWQIDAVRQSLDARNTAQNQALDWLSSMVERDAATMSAILSNKV